MKTKFGFWVASALILCGFSPWTALASMGEIVFIVGPEASWCGFTLSDPASLGFCSTSNFATVSQTAKIGDGYQFDGWYTMPDNVPDSGNASPNNCTVVLTNSETISSATIAKAKKCTGVGLNGYIICPKCSKISYTITVKGGSVSTQAYQIDTQPQSATVTYTPAGGYSVSSWLVEGAKGGTPAVSDNTLTIPAGTYGNLTLTPNTEPNQYTITVDPGVGGTGGGAISYETSASKQTFDLPTVSHNRTKLKDWTIGEECSSSPSVNKDLTKLTIPAKAYGDFTVTAKWDPYDITYNPGKSTQTKEHDVSAKLADKGKFSKTDYVQDGWSTEEGGEKVYELNQDYTDNEDLELWPHWAYVPKYYTLAVETDGKGSVSKDPEYQSNKYPENIKVTLTAEPKGGYAFEKWQPDGLTDPVRTVTTTNDLWYKAEFTNRWYTITFDPRGGSCDEASRVVEYNAQIGTLPIPELQGYTFDGWHTGLEPSAPSVQGTSPYTWTGDVTLYAHWKEGVKVTISGRASPEAAGRVEGGGSVVQGSPVKLTAIANEGYGFAYWNDEPQNMATQRTVTASYTKEYLAVFTGNVYKVTFRANGGKPDDQTKMVVYGEAYGELPSVTRSGFQLDGWYTDFDGEGDKIESDTIVSILKNQNLIANWIEIPTYTLRYDGHHADAGSMTNETIACGEAHALTPNSYERTGYTFAGWATNEADAAAHQWTYTDNAAVIDLAGQGGTSTLYAAWSNNPYRVIFELGEGVTWGGALTNACLYDVEWLIPEEVPESGDSLYVFAGWCWTNDIGSAVTNQPGDTVSNLTAVADGEVVLTPCWERDVGDFSRALGCDNLRFRNKNESAGRWLIETNGQTCVWNRLMEENMGNASLSAPITVSGTLTFEWAGESENENALKVNGKSYSVTENMTRMTTTVGVELPAEGEGFICFEHRNAKACYLYRVTWEPGELPPEPQPTPTEADRREISQISVTADGLGFVFTNADVRWIYSLHGTNDLLAPMALWPEVWKTNGSGTITIDLPRPVDNPSMFYYLETKGK